MIYSSFVSLLLQWDELDSDRDQEHERKRGGSLPGKAPNKNRNWFKGHIRLYNDYFAEVPVYSEAQFRRRFRMGRALFLKIHDKISTADHEFF